MGNIKIPLFKKADLDASIGVFFDGFSKVIVAIAILVGTFGLNGGTVFGTMMPGVLVSVIVLNGGLWLYYRHIAKQRGEANLTAIPAGLQAGRMFIWLFSIMPDRRSLRMFRQTVLCQDRRWEVLLSSL